MLHSFHWSTHLTIGCYTAIVGPLISPLGGLVTQLSLVYSSYHWVLHSYCWSTHLTIRRPCYTAFIGPLISTQLTTGWPCYTAFTGPLSSPLGGHVTQLSLVHSAHHWVAMLHSFHWSTQLTTGCVHTAFTGPLKLLGATLLAFIGPLISPLLLCSFSWSTQLTTGWPCYTAFTGPLSLPLGGHVHTAFTGPLSSSLGGHVTQLSLVHSAHHWVAMLHSFHWSTQLTTGLPCVTQLSLVHSAYHWVAMLHSFHWSTQLITGWPCYTAFTGPLSSPLGCCVTQLSLVHSAYHWVAMLHSFHWSTQLTTW